MPLRAQSRQFLVEGDADAAAHTHHHGFSLDRFEAVLEVPHDVGCDAVQPVVRSDDCLKLHPFCLEIFLALDLLTFGYFFGYFFEVGVDEMPFGFVDGQFDQSAFVVDRDGGLVFDGALEVVNADVVAEDSPGIGVLQLDRRGSESHEGGVGQCVSHVPCVSVYEVVLASVCFIGDNHDVVSAGKRGVGVVFVLGEEFLDGREDNPARLDGEFLVKVGAAFGPGRSLAQQVLTAREGGKELVVEVVAVGQDDDCGVAHSWFLDDGACVEGHREALSRSLRVPDHPDASIARFATWGVEVRAACVLGLDFVLEFGCA